MNPWGKPKSVKTSTVRAIVTYSLVTRICLEPHKIQISEPVWILGVPQIKEVTKQK